MKTYSIGFFENGDKLIASLGGLVLVDSAAYHDSTVTVQAPDDIAVGSIIGTLSQSGWWDGTIVDLDDEEPEEPAPAVPDAPVADELTKIFGGESDQFDVSFVDQEVVAIGDRLGLSTEQVTDVCLSIVSWFLPYTGSPVDLVSQVKAVNGKLSTLIESRLRTQQLEKIVLALEDMATGPGADSTECIEDVVLLIRRHWEELISHDLTEKSGVR